MSIVLYSVYVVRPVIGGSGGSRSLRSRARAHWALEVFLFAHR